MTSISRKTESTSQTYGQLIILPSQGELTRITVNKDEDSTNRLLTPDKSVKIVYNDSALAALSLRTSPTNRQRSKIAVAAVSDSAEATAVLSSPIASTVDGALRISDISSVVVNTVDSAIVLGSRHLSPQGRRRALERAKQIDFMFAIRTKESEAVEWVNIKQANPTSKCVYNFFEPTERDIGIQEDITLEPLLNKKIYNVPKYVKLNWEPVRITEPLKETPVLSQETQALLRDTYKVPQGTVDGPIGSSTYETSRKRLDLFNDGGRLVELADVHNLGRSMSVTSNRKVFSNTVSAVVNISDKFNTLPYLPLTLK